VAEQLRRASTRGALRIDVRQAPLMRGCVAYDADGDRWLLLLLLHHLASDHTALEILLGEVRAHLLGRADELPAALPFRNFVAQARLGVTQAEHEAFFGEMLGDVDEPTAPFGLVEVRGDGSGIVEARAAVDPRVAGQLREEARKRGVSAASLCHLAWALVLARISDRDDVVFGTILFGRMQGGAGSDRVMGPFINTLPVRVRVGGEGVEASVRRTHAMLAEVFRHEHASLALAQRCSGVQAAAPLFSALLNYRHGGGGKARPPEAREALKGIHGLRSDERTNYPVVLSVDDRGDGFGLVAQAPASVRPERLCAMMNRALEGIVSALVEAPSRPLASITVLPAEERRQVVEGWNATAAAFPSESCIHEMVEEQAGLAPDALAVVLGGRRVTYAELNARANQLAHHLREMGVEPDARVAVCMERSPEMTVALLGVLKAGGAYVPMDPSYPAERLRYMLDDSTPRVLLTQASLAAGFEGVQTPTLVLDGVDAEWTEQPATDPARAGLTPEHLAYVIYTSGSTGTPKGVAVTHRNVANLVAWHRAAFGLRAGDRTSSVAGVGFDAAAWEIWPALCSGASLHLAEDARDPGALLEWWAAQELDVSFLPTPMAEFAFTRGITNPHLRTLLVGGDRLRHFPAEPTTFALVNNYGPTETTVVATSGEVVAGGTLHIGRPIANTRVYIVDRSGNPAPVGVAGELYVGGAGVARGYLNRPELTGERFVDDRFTAEPGARMYRTGDLARWLADGTIEYLGRTDFQVKVRGFRIELGEIETRLAEHEGVREAVVLAREDQPGDTRLVAYYVADEALDAQALRSALAGRLPDHMVPAAFVHLAALPLTPNGKVDRRALPAPEGDAYATRGYEAPAGRTETILAEIWGDVLGVERVGRWDNFFELGGHSLRAVTLVERMRQRGLHTEVGALFTTATLSDLAAQVSGESRDVHVPPNTILAGCDTITPEMVPLIALTQGEIDAVLASVPGGAANVQDIYPLAPLQEGILFHHLLAAAGDPYLLEILTSFDTRDRLNGFVDALRAVIARHDILRTAIAWEVVPEPVQVVWRDAPLVVEEVELDPAEGDASRQLLARFDPRHHRIDVRRAPLMRTVVAYDAVERRWLLLLLRHHLASDHTTLDVLMAEIQAHLLGRQADLPAPLPFRNFVAQARLGVSQAEHEEFFQGMLADVDEPTAPFGLIDAWGDGSAVREAKLEVDASLSARLRERARKLGVSAGTVFHVAWARVLARASGRDDVVFGTVLFGRMQGGAGADRVMGPFINTLPVRVRVAGEGVEASVRRTHALLADVLRHEHASLALAQRCSGVHAPAPLFSALLNYRHSAGKAEPEDTRRAWTGFQGVHSEERTNYPVVLSVDDLGDGFRLVAQVPDPVGAERVCAMMHKTLEGLVRALETAPSRALASIGVLPDEERWKVTREWNELAAEYPRDLCVHELFEAQVRRTPDAVALAFGDERLTYAELNGRANGVAHQLLKLGVSPDARVAICVERSPEMIVALLAVLKAGGAYVPLDPAYPVARLRFMLRDSAPLAVLTHGMEAELRDELLAGLDLPVLDLAGAEEWEGERDVNPACPGLSPDHLAYVIYTSGSTGRPKGVGVAHQNVARLFTATDHWFSFGPADVWTLFHSFAFDFSVWEIWGALLYGGRLVVVPKDTARTPEEFYRLVCREGVTVLNQTPGAFRQLIAAQAASGEEHQLRHVIFGGEALELPTLKPWFERNDDRRTRLINMYGITETTVHVTYRPISAADADRPGASPIGGRIPDLRLYILDGTGEPVPMGVAGELHVGGAGVARGYLNRPALTAQKFIPDPFGPAGGRLYQTGDLGRWLPDGTIEYLGRLDQQVKIRGFRIELGEIDARLLEQDGVREATTVTREDTPGDTQLIAYYVADEVLDAHRLRAYLAERLPVHMIPGAYVWLAAMPLTVNGKLDRKALPAPEGVAFAARGYEAPVGAIEIALAEIWADVLGLERVGRWDDFFELGGHSLRAVQIISRVRQVLGMDVALGALFLRSVLADFARVLEHVVHAELPPIARVERGAAGLALSFAQQRLWFLEQMGGLGSTYHMRRRLRLHGELDRAAMVRALDRIVARHEALRTTFVVVDGEPEQRITPVAASRFSLREHDVSGDVVPDAALGAIMAAEAELPFDLERGPLIRGHLVRLAADDHLLIVTMHHIVSDGWSLGVFVHELSTLYGAFRAGAPDPLPRLAVQYADYAAWQRKWVTGEVLRQQADYWKTTLAGAPELLELPTDHPRPAQRDFSGAVARVELDEELTAGLRALSRRAGTTLFMTLLAGWAAVLSRLAGQTDVVIGTPTANRGRAEIEGLIGFFVNILVVRLDLSGRPAVRDLLAGVKSRVLEAQQHQDIPFEQVVELAQPVRSLAHSPVFQVMFNWQNAPTGRLELPGLTLGSVGGEQRGAATFDLSLSLQESGGRIVGGVTYATALFEQETMDRHVGYLRRALEEMVAGERRPVELLELLPAAERALVVGEWNSTVAEYPAESCLHELFEEEVERAPEAVAVVFDGESMTYAALNRRANRLAHYLRTRGVGPDVRVAIAVERGLEMMVALLGVLKAGGAYVPLDPSYPAERLRATLEDSAPAVLLTQAALARRYESLDIPILSLDADAALWADRPKSNPERDGLTPDHLAYVIYTSGSTGRPKGVMNLHGGVVNLLASMRESLRVDADDRLLAVTTLAFDISVLELFLPLMSGARVEILPRAASADPVLLREAIEESGATILQATPATWRLLVDGGWAGAPELRALSGGEALTAELATLVRDRVGSLWNVYGPTETTIWSCAQAVETVAEGERGPVSIGAPLANTRVYVLDSAFEPVPVGVAGELYIGGAGVARGYLNQPHLTAERFVADAYSGEPGARLYGTGDRVRWLADGTLDFLGRSDFQVKIRGFRIELGEIEARLAAHPAVREATVAAREDVPGDTCLVAYWVGEEVDDVQELRAHLSERLPEHMVPAAYVRLAALPLTPNGKLDRKALPAPDGAAYVTRGYEAPVGETEEELAAIWAEVLRVERVGRWDDFFALGGHSLRAVQMISRVRQLMGMDVALGELFVRPVLEDFARVLEQAAQAELSTIEPVERGRRAGALLRPAAALVPGADGRDGRHVPHADPAAAARRAERRRAGRRAGPDRGAPRGAPHHLPPRRGRAAAAHRRGGGERLRPHPPRPRRAPRGGGQARHHHGDGVGRAVRHGARAADPRAPGAHGRRRPRTPGDDAPRRLRRVVARRLRPRAEHAVRRVRPGRARSAPPARGAVRRLRGVAAEVGDGRGPPPAGGLLEGDARRGAGAAGASRRPPASGAAGVRGGAGEDRAGRGPHDRAPRAEPAPRHHALHDAARGVGRRPGPPLRADGPGGRHADGQPGAERDGGIDRLLREHARAPLRPGGLADGDRAAGAGEVAGAGSAGEPGHPLRAGGGAGAPRALPGPHPRLPGDVHLAERSRGAAGASGAHGGLGGSGAAHDRQVRPFALAAGIGREDRGRRRVLHRAVRRGNGGPAHGLPAPRARGDGGRRAPPGGRARDAPEGGAEAAGGEVERHRRRVPARLHGARALRGPGGEHAGRRGGRLRRRAADLRRAEPARQPPGPPPPRARRGSERAGGARPSALRGAGDRRAGDAQGGRRVRPGRSVAPRRADRVHGGGQRVARGAEPRRRPGAGARGGADRRRFRPRGRR
jgi:amino acid adenylation domain-containing protein